MSDDRTIEQLREDAQAMSRLWDTLSAEWKRMHVALEEIAYTSPDGLESQKLARRTLAELHSPITVAKGRG